MRVRSQPDLIGGIIYLFFGLLATVLASGYPMGRPAAAGPGFFPFWVGILMSLIGAWVIVQSFLQKADNDSVAYEKIERVDVRAIIAVLGAVGCFILLIRPLGFFITIALTVVFATLVVYPKRVLASIVSGLVIAALCSVVFVIALRLPIRILPPGLGL